ncbi:hypothetical protein AAIH08_34095, partial [Pseudomonas aeruginosa]
GDEEASVRAPAEQLAKIVSEVCAVRWRGGGRLSGGRG